MSGAAAAAAPTDEPVVDEYLGMSDEDFANLDSAFLDTPPAAEADAAADDDASDEADDEPGEEAGDDDDQGIDPPPVKEDPPADSEGEPAADPDPDPEAKADGDAEKAEGDDKDKPVEVDYKAAYEQLTAPFRANGKDMKVESVDDAIRLMQMGANYNRKMAALKPNLKLLKTLEKNNLLDETKLSFLIDLEKKNPQAIARLLTEAKIDPLELDLDQGKTYKESSYTVDDREMDLDSVIEELRDSETYTRTIDVVANKWDAKSKQVVADNPQLLSVIDDHMARGIYDLISTEVERERTLGRLQGMSDLDAYKATGDAIDARGGFNHLVKGKTPEPAPVEAPAPAATPPAKVDDSRRRDKRRAASPPKPAAGGAPGGDFNPLSLSDDDFAKQFDPRLL